MKRLTILFVLLVCLNPIASQQTVSISRGFFTGKDYFDMSDTEKRAYATGAVNGMLVAPFFGAPEDRLTWLKSCTAKMSDQQTALILTSFLESDSNRLAMPLNVVTFNALKDTCDKMKN